MNKDTDGFFQFVVETGLIKSKFIRKTGEQAFVITDHGRVIRDFLTALEPTKIQEQIQKELDNTVKLQESENFDNYDNPESHSMWYEAKISGLQLALEKFKEAECEVKA